MTEESNKDIIGQGNTAITAGNNEWFPVLCTDDIVRHFVGDKALHGKEAVC